MFVLSQCDFCSPALRFCTTRMASGKAKKTRTSVSFIPGWLLDFVSRLHEDWVANTSHALPVPVYRHPISHGNEWSFRVTWYRCTGVKFSLRENNRGELTTVWLAPTWHFVVVSCKQIQSNKKKPGLTRAGAKVAPARRHVNTRLPHVR